MAASPPTINLETLAADEKQARRRKLRVRPLSRVRIAHTRGKATRLASLRSFGNVDRHALAFAWEQ
jgi:hypothetical protein